MKKITLLCIAAFAFVSASKASNKLLAYAMQNTNSSNCEFFFRDSFYNLGYTPTSFFWDFGDSSTASIQNPTHQYAVNRTYVVTHIVSNGSNSDTDIFNMVVSCSQNLPLNADFSYNFNDTVPNYLYHFNNTSVGNYTSSYWDFGDGNYSTLTHPSHHFNGNTQQTYTVKLVVSNSTKSDTITKNITTYLYDSCKVFKAYFIANRDSNCMKMNFFKVSHYSATTHYWDFGDGSTSTSVNPSHTYAAIGYYDVKLKITKGACKDSIVEPTRVTCRTCFSVTAIIDLQVDSTNPSKAKLINTSSGPVASHFWDFGDGSTSTANAPTHTYTSPGKIRLKYICTDTGTCSDTAYIDFEIDSLGNIKRGTVNFTLQVIDKTKTSSIKTTQKLAITLGIYPNPASNNIQLSNTGNNDLKVSIFDHQGKLLRQLSLPSKSAEGIDLSTWTSGIYLIQTDTGQTLKFIKE